MNPWHRVGFLVGLVLLVRGLATVSGLILPTPASALVGEVVFLVATVSLARSFRGWGEPVGPSRAWWRLTARSRAGWWLGGMWVLAAASAFTQRERSYPWWEVVQFIDSGILGLAFLNSSVRLTIRRRHPQP